MFENRLDSYRNVFVNILAILPIEYKSQVFVRLSLCKYFTMYLKYVIHKLILVNKKSDNSIHFKTTSYIDFFPPECNISVDKINHIFCDRACSRFFISFQHIQN